MVIQYKPIKVNYDDVTRMRTKVRELVIKRNPDLEQTKITDRMLFNILVNHALG